MIAYEYTNGFLERNKEGAYKGKITIEGVNIPSIVGVYFKREGETFLWLKRPKVLEYDHTTEKYREREAKPQWEVYMKKQNEGDTVAYKGEFNFLHFRFAIIGIWDRVLGMDKQHRMNLYVERLPMNEQTIINGINERKRHEQERRTNKR